MSFLAKLKLDGKEYNVKSYSIKMSQSVDRTGKIVSNPSGGHIDIVVEADKDTSLFMWMSSSVQLKNGEIVFYKRDALSNLRVVNFSNGYCIEYEEEFTSETSVAMLIRIKVSAESIEINGEKFQKNWPKIA